MKKFIPLLALILCLSASCRRSNERRYELTGKIVAVEPDKHQITVSHEEIKGYMPGMTMPFRVRDRALLAERTPGELIRATLDDIKRTRGRVVIIGSVSGHVGMPNSSAYAAA